MHTHSLYLSLSISLLAARPSGSLRIKVVVSEVQLKEGWLSQRGEEIGKRGKERTGRMVGWWDKNVARV